MGHDASKRLISNTNWQLFMLVFPELHRAAHYFCPDPESPQFDQQDMLLRELYEALDEGLGELLTSIDTDTLGSFSGRIMTGRGGNHRPNAFLLLSREAARRSENLAKPTHIAELGAFVCALATE